MSTLRGSRALLYYHTHTEHRYQESNSLMRAMHRHDLAHQDAGGGWYTSNEEIDRFLLLKEEAGGRSVHASMSSATVSPLFNTPVGGGSATALDVRRTIVAPPPPTPEEVELRRPWSWTHWIKNGSIQSNAAGFSYPDDEAPVYYALSEDFEERWREREVGCDARFTSY